MNILNPYIHNKKLLSINDIVSYWPLVTDANDAVGSNHGVISGATFSLDGLKGGSLLFVNNSDKVTIADDDSLSFAPNNPFSIIHCVKFTATSGSHYYINKGLEYEIRYLHGNGHHTAIIHNSSGGLFTKRRGSTGPATTGVWYVVISTYNGTPVTGLDIYVNAAKGNQSSQSGTYTAMGNKNTPLILGTDSGNNYGLKGNLCEVYLIKGAISEEKVAPITTALLSGKTIF